VLSGAGYKQIVEMVEKNWRVGLTRDIISLVRTHIQTVQNAASKMVAEQNKDILQKQWEWCSILDNRACLHCIGLDGRMFDMGDDIDIPYHLRCRCIRKWKTKSWAEITGGKVSLPAAERKMRNWTWRDQGNIDTGGKPLLDYGRIDGSFEDFYNSLSFARQSELIGPSRAEMLKLGKVSFRDLTTSRGEVYALNKKGTGLSNNTY